MAKERRERMKNEMRFATKERGERLVSKCGFFFHKLYIYIYIFEFGLPELLDRA